MNDSAGCLELLIHFIFHDEELSEQKDFDSFSKEVHWEGEDQINQKEDLQFGLCFEDEIFVAPDHIYMVWVPIDRKLNLDILHDSVPEKEDHWGKVQITRLAGNSWQNIEEILAVAAHQDLCEVFSARLGILADPENTDQGACEGHEKGVWHVEQTHDNEDCLEERLYVVEVRLEIGSPGVHLLWLLL